MVQIDTTMGTFSVELYYKHAPKTGMHRQCIACVLPPFATWWQEAAVSRASCAMIGCAHTSADSLNPCFRDQVKNFQELSKKGYYDGTVVSAGLASAVISHA